MAALKQNHIQRYARDKNRGVRGTRNWRSANRIKRSFIDCAVCVVQAARSIKSDGIELANPLNDHFERILIVRVNTFHILHLRSSDEICNTH
jgi:hypothetical protein